ncbi:MAG TPA: isocitrate lyase/phosphoenolpyruvate mutase family protein [Stellaceae bacterium]|jgi:2-methylisocitrate lyase-like PEP mutase family enzyme|nr:isocitrate lyase/phosphoenolpyruvate mutase family protein [Stellaceae bacterium]
MDKNEQAKRAQILRSLHRPPPILLLPNAWDLMSARIFADAGYPAIATTSGGVAWALGYADGEKTPWNEVVEATSKIAAAVSVPVTADIEAGYSKAPEDVARHVVEIAQAGAAGANLEDGAGGGLRSIEDAAARIAATRRAVTDAGLDLVINARTDVYLHGSGDAAARLEETIKRGKAYLAAGADCIYVFALTDLATITSITRALAAPVNIIGRAGTPPLAALEAAGVARVSIATGATLATASLVQQLAKDLRAKGDFSMLEHRMTRAEAQQLFGQQKG